MEKPLSGMLLVVLVSALFSTSIILRSNENLALVTVPDDYLTIQQAINNATPGDTVYVKEGTYFEHVFLNKTVQLIGENGSAIIDGSGWGVGIHVTADNVDVSGFSVQNCEGCIKVEGDENAILSNVVSSIMYNESLVEPGQEIYQDHVSPTSRWYLHNLINGSYTGYFNITEFVPVISVHAYGYETEVEELAIGLFHDQNHDDVPQLTEFVGWMDGKERNVAAHLYAPPEGQYIIKVMGWVVSGDPGHFDLEIAKHRGYGIGFFSSTSNLIKENLAANNTVGICLSNTDNTTVSLNNATRNFSGIVGINSQNCSFNQNRACENYRGPGFSLWSFRNTSLVENNASSNIFGIMLWNSSENQLSMNTMLYNPGWALGLHASDRNEVADNNMSFTSVLDGVRMMFACWNNLSENTISNNGHAGVFLWLENDHNRIVSNQFYSNGEHGVELKFSDNNTIAQNDVGFIGKNGILIIESTGCTIKENNVFSNLRGIMFYDAYGNEVYRNNIIDNTEQQAGDIRSANSWDTGYPLGGNYWSDYEGNDLNNDGLGDTPYSVPENSTDNHPLIYPWPELQVSARVNGSRAYNYDLQLENIAYLHPAFRAGGSSGANETANWIRNQFSSFGLETWLEPFEFTTWNLQDNPSLLIDEDGNKTTTHDQTAISHFQCQHYSWPTAENGTFADLVVLPLPEATNYNEIGMNPINLTSWNTINTTGKILLIGREIRLSSIWQEAYVNKLTAQPPAAVIYTWWYEWMSFVPDYSSSIGGRPASNWGPYYWNLEIPVGFVGYEDGLWIRTAEQSNDVSANVTIESNIDIGTHYNVVAKIQGYEEPEKMVIISGHYDTVMCSGFCDNGAGTSGVIELANVFAEAVEQGIYRPRYTLLFVAFASEEVFLVGSINYVKQHKSEMADIVAVINLDCIGSDNLYITGTNPSDGFDLDEVMWTAASDLGINATVQHSAGSDHETFRAPSWANDVHLWSWGIDPGISDATPVESSGMLISYPIVYSDLWSIGAAGWIHTSYDNSTSTGTLQWVETEDLENHVKVAAIAIMRILLPKTAPVTGDINRDGTVDIFDAILLAGAFGSQPGDASWDLRADLNNDNIVDIFDAIILAGHFGES